MHIKHRFRQFSYCCVTHLSYNHLENTASKLLHWYVLGIVA
jgi:hypothetical protein